MQTSTVVVLLCLIAAVAVRAQQEPTPVDAQESLLDTPTHDRSPRTKRGLLLLKKKLLLGIAKIAMALKYCKMFLKYYKKGLKYFNMVMKFLKKKKH